MKELQVLRRRVFKSVEESTRLKVDFKTLEEELRSLRQQHQDEEQNQRLLEQKVESGKKERETQRLALREMLQQNRLKTIRGGGVGRGNGIF